MVKKSEKVSALDLSDDSDLIDEDGDAVMETDSLFVANMMDECSLCSLPCLTLLGLLEICIREPDDFDSLIEGGSRQVEEEEGELILKCTLIGKSSETVFVR